VNLQEVRSQAKPHQIRQFLRLVERYALRMEDGRLGADDVLLSI
jgi:hypothetical protein